MMMMLMFSLQMGRGMPKKQKVLDLFISQGSWGAEKQTVLNFVHCTRVLACAKTKKFWICS
jgi:hypothetical protein